MELQQSWQLQVSYNYYYKLLFYIWEIQYELYTTTSIMIRQYYSHRESSTEVYIIRQVRWSLPSSCKFATSSTQITCWSCRAGRRAYATWRGSGGREDSVVRAAKISLLLRSTWIQDRRREIANNFNIGSKPDDPAIDGRYIIFRATFHVESLSLSSWQRPRISRCRSLLRRVGSEGAQLAEWKGFQRRFI